MKRKRRILLDLLAAPILIFCTTVVFAQSTLKYTLVDIGLMGGTSAVATGINNNGQVTGYIDYADGHQDCFLLKLFVGYVTWSSNVGSKAVHNYCIPYAINQSGAVAGSMLVQVGKSFVLHGFQRTASGQIVDLPPLFGGTSNAYGLNDYGLAVGESDTNGQYPTSVMWDSAGHGVALPALSGANNAVAGAINLYGIIAGWSNGYGSGSPYGVEWSTSGLQVALPRMSPYPAYYDRAYAVGSGPSPEIAGIAIQPGGNSDLVVWGPGWQGDLGNINYGVPRSVSSDNWIYGGMFGSNAINTWFLHSPACPSIYWVSNLLDSSSSGWYLSTAGGMNDSHIMVGSAFFGTAVDHAVLLYPNNSPLCFGS